MKNNQIIHDFLNDTYYLHNKIVEKTEDSEHGIEIFFSKNTIWSLLDSFIFKATESETQIFITTCYKINGKVFKRNYQYAKKLTKRVNYDLSYSKKEIIIHPILDLLNVHLGQTTNFLFKFFNLKRLNNERIVYKDYKFYTFKDLAFVYKEVVFFLGLSANDELENNLHLFFYPVKGCESFTSFNLNFVAEQDYKIEMVYSLSSKLISSLIDLFDEKIESIKNQEIIELQKIKNLQLLNNYIVEKDLMNFNRNYFFPLIEHKKLLIDFEILDVEKLEQILEILKDKKCN